MKGFHRAYARGRKCARTTPGVNGCSWRSGAGTAVGPRCRPPSKPAGLHTI